MPQPSTTPVGDSIVLSEDRDSADQPATSLIQELEARRAHLATAIAALKLQAGQFDQLDWEGLAAHDPDRAEHLWTQRQGLEEMLGHAADELHELGGAIEAHAHEQHARRISDGHAVLARDLPGWSPQLAAQLAAYGRDHFDFTPQELAEVHDPRLVKLLHRAFVSHETAKAAGIAQSQKTQPAARVRGSGAALPAAADTGDFAAFEALADSRLKRR